MITKKTETMKRRNDRETVDHEPARVTDHVHGVPTPAEPTPVDPVHYAHPDHTTHDTYHANSNAQYLAAAQAGEGLNNETVDQRLARQKLAQVEKRKIKAGIPQEPDVPVALAYPNPLTPLQKLHKELVAAKREAEKPDAKEALKHINEAKAMAEKLLGA